MAHVHTAPGTFSVTRTVTLASLAFIVESDELTDCESVEFPLHVTPVQVVDIDPSELTKVVDIPLRMKLIREPSARVIYPAESPHVGFPPDTELLQPVEEVPAVSPDIDIVVITDPSERVLRVTFGFASRFASSSANSSAETPSGRVRSAMNPTMNEERNQLKFFIRVYILIKIYRQKC